MRKCVILCHIMCVRICEDVRAFGGRGCARPVKLPHVDGTFDLRETKSLILPTGKQSVDN